MRKPFEGVFNIIRFNRHFFVIALLTILILFISGIYLENWIGMIFIVSGFLLFLPIVVSLVTSYYVYDVSGIYSLNWIKDVPEKGVIVNINAGFDETSSLLKEKFEHSDLHVFDFYNAEKHTEVSIKRARKRYPPFHGTVKIETGSIPMDDNSADVIFVILSAHEIRDTAERLSFFKELRRIIKPEGKIYVTEHLRDFPNLFAYNIGFFHFFSKKSWRSIFTSAKLNIKKELKLTPFISNFILEKNGNTN